MTVGSHLSTEVVSDLLEGLLSEQDRVAAEEHLASCAQCTDVAEALVGVRDVLRSAPPPPMPADIAERITAALAVESASRADETGVVSIGQARQRKLSRRAAQFLIAAASVAVVAVGGGIVVNSITKEDPITAIQGGTPSATPKPGIPAGKLYLSHEGSASLTSAGFAAEAAKLLTTSKPRPSKAPPGVRPMDTPLPCISEIIGGEPRDFRQVRYDGQDAYLAIINPPNTDIIRAYVVTGCPTAGALADEDVLAH